MLGSGVSLCVLRSRRDRHLSTCARRPTAIGVVQVIVGREGVWRNSGVINTRVLALPVACDGRGHRLPALVTTSAPNSVEKREEVLAQYPLGELRKLVLVPVRGAKADGTV
jgi:hypothetical protein